MIQQHPIDMLSICTTSTHCKQTSYPLSCLFAACMQWTVHSCRSVAGKHIKLNDASACCGPASQAPTLSCKRIGHLADITALHRAGYLELLRSCPDSPAALDALIATCATPGADVPVRFLAEGAAFTHLCRDAGKLAAILGCACCICELMSCSMS